MPRPRTAAAPFRPLVRWFILAVWMALFAVPAAAQSEPPVVLQGATTFVSRLMEPYAQEIEKRTGLQVMAIGTKSIHGLVALLDNRATLAMISAPLESELVLLRKQYPAAILDTLQSFEIARSSVAFAVHPDNPVKAVTLDDIRRVLTGAVTSWKDLGGPDLPIRPVFVREGGGVVLSVKTQVLAGQEITAPHAVRVDSPRQLLKILAQEPGALGLAQERPALQAGLPRLDTDGAVHQTLNLVSLGPPSATAKAVIDAARAVATERLY